MNEIITSDYFPGQNCHCEARSSYECGCDADWTPVEVYKLREDARQLADRLTALELHSTNELARLERERDEAREKTERYRIEANAIMMQRDEWAAMCGRYKQERDEAQDKYATEATDHMLAVNKLCGERDEARDALMKIEDLFIDCTDIYEDFKNMGMIAKTALEETK